jgi:predicted nuclease of predicted toxin-antitoxin system
MKRLLLDQGLPRNSVASLQRASFDVLHVGDIGLAAASDVTILDYARSENRTVITLDADFHTLLALSGADRPSVVRLRLQGLRADALAVVVCAVWKQAEDALSRGAVVTVTGELIRIRLPIEREKKGAGRNP